MKIWIVEDKEGNCDSYRWFQDNPNIDSAKECIVYPSDLRRLKEIEVHLKWREDFLEDVYLEETTTNKYITEKEWNELLSLMESRTNLSRFIGKKVPISKIKGSFQGLIHSTGCFGFTNLELFEINMRTLNVKAEPCREEASYILRKI